MEKPKTEPTATTAADLNFYQSGEFLGGDIATTNPLGRVYKQFSAMNRDGYENFSLQIPRQEAEEDDGSSSSAEFDEVPHDHLPPPPPPAASNSVPGGAAAAMQGELDKIDSLFTDLPPMENYNISSDPHPLFYDAGNVSPLTGRPPTTQLPPADHHMESVMGPLGPLGGMEQLTAISALNMLNAMPHDDKMFQLPPVPSQLAQVPRNLNLSLHQSAETYDAPRKRRRTSRRKSSVSSTRRSIKESSPTLYTILPNVDRTETPLNELAYYRRPNGITFDDLRHADTSDGITFEPNKKAGASDYEPYVNKKYSAAFGSSEAKAKGSGQGNFALCPFCERTPENVANNCEKLFYKRNDSNYLHHLIQFHGIFSNGEKVRDPKVRAWAVTLADKSPVEVTQCPYCDEFISLKKYKPANPNEHRLLKYLRHVKEKHKTGKNLQILNGQK